MTAPKLVFAGPNGQTAVRALFDQPMREIGLTDPRDPGNPANWTGGGGLPAIVNVNRLSDVEFELILTSPAPAAGGYTVSVAATVENLSGEPMDAGFLTSPAFAVTVLDFTVASLVWVTPSELDIIFSEPYATIMFDEYHEVVQMLALNGGREPAVIGLAQSGATLKVTIENPGTAGADYSIALNREVFVSLATNITLKSGDENLPVYGQGAAPTIAALALLEDDA